MSPTRVPGHKTKLKASIEGESEFKVKKMSRELRDADRPILQFAVPLFTHSPSCCEKLPEVLKERALDLLRGLTPYTQICGWGKHVIKGGTSNYFLRGMHYFYIT